MSTTRLKDAATIVVLREGEAPFEVFMLRRHHGHAFMANAWVFPGGKLDARDKEVVLKGQLSGLDADEAARRMGGKVDGETALGLYVAALRETFEESGLLLARRRGDDEVLSFEDPQTRRHFDELRRAVDEAEMGMGELCRGEDLVLCAEELIFFAHWITPHFESRRYDTRFFVAHAPSRQRPSHDERESTNSAWWTPEEAIERYRREEILLAPPTLRILEELAAYSSVEEAMDSLRKRPCPPTILPHLHEESSGEEMVLLLPGDPEFPAHDPRLSMAEPVVQAVTRMVCRQGQWYSAKRQPKI